MQITSQMISVPFSHLFLYLLKLLQLGNILLQCGELLLISNCILLKSGQGLLVLLLQLPLLLHLLLQLLVQLLQLLKLGKLLGVLLQGGLQLRLLLGAFAVDHLA